MKLNIIFFFCIFIFQSNSFTIHALGGTSLKDCKIKFHDFDWQNIDNCDKTEFDMSWPGADAEVANIHIDYNIGDIINIWIKAFNNVPYQEGYEDYCSIYMHIYINEYYINNNKDYIYYCTNCDCTSSLGDKTFCHKWDDKRLYCNPIRGKEYNFFVRINGYHELDLMDTQTIINNYYKLFGSDFYLSEFQDNQEIKFSSDKILISSYDPKHIVNLNELSIKYSIEGLGEFITINGETLSSSGVIGSDIIFIKPKNIEGNKTFHTKFTAQTISKFGFNKGSSTSSPVEFNFYFCAPGYKMSKNKTCYKCFESCFNCSEPGNSITHHCEKCNHLNPFYFYLNDTKNCNPSCKSANKVRSKKTEYICIDKDECKYYISSDEESCIESCPSESEYFDYRTGNMSKICLNHCDEYISNSHIICLDSCKRVNQLIDHINMNKICLTENLCIQYKKFINSDKTSCNQNCSSISELQDNRYNDYSPICLSYSQCDRFISYNEEKCIYDCPKESEYYDDRNGIRSKRCLIKEKCDSWISSNNTICLKECKTIGELINNININKICTTEEFCILYKKFINSDKTSCNQNCSSISELQDNRYNDYSPICLSYSQCDRFISYNEEKCIYDCPKESEYYDDRNGIRSKRCLIKEKCDSWISSNNTICLKECKAIGELSDLNNHLCVQFCDNNMFYTPELMICDNQCKDPFKYYIKYENKTKKCVKKCDEFPYIVLDEDNSECLIFNKFEIISIQMNPIFNSNKEKFPIYSISKGTKNITIKITFNQDIRKRIKLLKGNFEKNSENNNSIIIKIEELNKNQIFNFTDNINDTYFFGFEIDLISSIDPLLIILIVISCFLLFFLILTIYLCKKQKKPEAIRKNSFLDLNNSNSNYNN